MRRLTIRCERKEGTVLAAQQVLAQMQHLFELRMRSCLSLIRTKSKTCPISCKSGGT